MTKRHIKVIDGNLKKKKLMAKIKITKIVDWDIALDDALFTINKENKHKVPSNKWIAKACLAEHSMIRDVRYILEMNEIPCWVSQHIARHDAFSHHTVRESEETHFVGTSRTDRTGIDRNKLPQDTPVNHRISLSAQDFITISQRRLCACASKETRELWKSVIEELRKIDPVLADKCVPMCVYRGFCPEFDSCGYVNTTAFTEKLKDYRDIEKYSAKSNEPKPLEITPEMLEEFEKNQFKNGWKDIGNGLKMDEHGHIAGGLKPSNYQALKLK